MITASELAGFFAAQMTVAFAVTVVASPLEAALLEHDAIRSLRPPYNVQLRTYIKQHTPK